MTFTIIVIVAVIAVGIIGVLLILFAPKRWFHEKGDDPAAVARLADANISTSQLHEHEHDA